MLVEGVGVTAPSKQKHVFTLAELLILADVAKERAEYRQYRKGDAWQGGQLDDITLPGVGKLTKDERPIFVGLLGEAATQVYIDKRFPEAGCVVDTSLLPHGDFGVDLKPFGLKIDVKTREFRASLDGINRIKRTNDRGLMPLHPHAFLFAEWDWDAPTVVNLVGWQWSKFVAELPLMPGKTGKWMNACVFDRHLLPMSRMSDALEAWKARQAWL